MRGLRKIKPYTPGEQPKRKRMIKINTNENAYLPSPKVLAALKAFDGNDLRLYSSLTNDTLISALAENLKVPASKITTGNGSDDVLALAFQSFFNTDDPIIFPDLTYGFYSVWCDLFRIPYQEVPLNQAFEFDFAAIPEKVGGIVLANPNAPTGIFKSLSEIERLLEKYSDVVVIVDEAYIAFGGKSAVPLLEKYDNLYITRTFSKDAALAGLRVGYGLGNEKLTSVIQAVKNAYNPYAVDLIAEALATAAVKDVAYYQQINQEIANVRDWFIDELAALGFSTLASQTNFVLTTHQNASAQELFEGLKAKDIYVRFFPNQERLRDFLRISIGKKEEMQEVLRVLQEILTR
ncbi:MAG: histidinol-phosphate transaminase [Streptococcaceae bacterium]|jgi:histidinol-phosphate aminotransferase|nr:histidinol-phosphate transaminase [Streptococcaceae bacterium]